MQAKLRWADFVGWQTGYAFHTLRGQPDAASDAGGQRKESDYQTTLASAVEEQTATTDEMSRSVAETATGSTGSTDIAANIIGVAQAAAATQSGVTTNRSD